MSNIQSAKKTNFYFYFCSWLLLSSLMCNLKPRCLNFSFFFFFSTDFSKHSPVTVHTSHSTMRAVSKTLQSLFVSVQHEAWMEENSKRSEKILIWWWLHVNLDLLNTYTVWRFPCQSLSFKIMCLAVMLFDEVCY